MSKSTMNKITANLIVDSIPEGLRFWVDRLGFEKTVEVPHEKEIGFVILKRGGVELMLQSRASLRGDIPAAAEGPHHATLYIEVPDLAPIRKALEGWPQVMPERTTFYGAREIIVKDPAGHLVLFSMHA
jgi:uncharacterized glyoxalase superfamily protein PhnB